MLDSTHGAEQVLKIARNRMSVEDDVRGIPTIKDVWKSVNKSY